jgi:serine phosphatase RsbU (regulator of sigma subunit)
MDIALAMIDYKKHRVHFSGANQSVYILRKNELYELKGDRMPIGRQFGEQRIFQEYTWDLEEGDLLYAFSDGYVDQFGGERNKKYSKKRLRKKLAKWCSLDLQEQKYRLIDEFIRWKGKTEQIDDVIFFGMKYTGKN